MIHGKEDLSEHPMPVWKRLEKIKHAGVPNIIRGQNPRAVAQKTFRLTMGK